MTSAEMLRTSVREVTLLQFCNVLRNTIGMESANAASSEEVHLRHVEKDVLIPKMMREKAKERCAEKVQAFNHCCKESGFFMVFKCREENTALKECLTLHYKDPAFFEVCKQEYIQEKLQFEQTGIPSKSRKQKLPTSM